MSDLYIFEKHDELLSFWRERQACGLKVLHVDFHDDLRDFLIDRKKGWLHRTGFLREHPSPPDEGSFLGHAVMEGMIDELQWIYSEPGGRAYDSGIVKYETDLAALPHRLGRAFRRSPTYPLQYKEVSFDQWTCPDGDWVLDLDWDFFASSEFEAGSVSDRIETFLKKADGLKPKEIYLTYSAAYVHPMKEAFEDFIERLSPSVHWPAGNFLARMPEEAPPKAQSTSKQILLGFFRKRGIF